LSNLSGSTEKHTRRVIQNKGTVGRDLNQGLSEYEPPESYSLDGDVKGSTLIIIIIIIIINAGCVSNMKKLLTTISRGHTLAKNEYLMRHDKVCTHLHYSVCKALDTETTDKWYTHTCTSQSVKRETSQCCGIKQYTQTEKLQQIGQI